MADLHQRLVAAVGNRYTIEREIGRGGMGVVYHGVDRRLKRHVAIKVLPPELAFRSDVRTRFLREAQTAAQLSHPNIVPIYEVDEREGLVFFVMALVDGENLASRLASEPRPPAEMVARVLRDVADALSAAHARGIIHRDVKPDNILLERSHDRAMVTDFGIARAAEGGSRLTATGVAVGTPTYMSPEQAEGAAEIDGRSDIYSLAVVGYQMLAGEPPFTATNTPALLMQHLTDEPPPLRSRRPDVPARLEGVITRALAKRPEDRWPDAAAMRDALDAVLAEMRSPPAARPALDATLAIDARGASVAPGGTVTPPAPEAQARPAEDLHHVAREMPAARVRTDASAAAPHQDDRAVTAPRADRNAARGDESAHGTPGAGGARGAARGDAGGVRRAAEPPRAPERGTGAPPPPRLPAPLRPPLPADPRRDSTLPPWMPESWREARRQWRASARERRGEWTPGQGSRALGRAPGARAMRDRTDPLAGAPVDQKIVAFRRQTASTAVRVGVLAVINAVTTPFVPWFLFPAAFMGIRLAHRGSDLWANGVRFKDVFGPEARARIDRVRAAGGVSASRGALEPSIEELALKLAPREVLAGPFGDTVRHAADDRRVAMDAMVRMPKADRDLIPDVGPTVDALAERVGALAQALHRLDEDVRPGAVEQLDQRIAALRAESADTPDHERRLALLERQRSTVADLAQRREALAAQIESAALMLQNVRLDLVALRSAGVQASIDSSSSATQEARALSRELGYVLDAAKKIRE